MINLLNNVNHRDIFDFNAIATNKPNNISTINVLSISLTDFDMTVIIKAINFQLSEMRTLKCFNYVTYDVDAINQDNMDIDWQLVYQSANIDFSL